MPASYDPLLEGRQLGAVRGEQILFRNLNLKVRANELWLLRGANGSGKTTLLRMLCGLSVPSAGRVLWQGKQMGRDFSAAHEQLLYLGHTNGIKLALSPRQNLEFAQAVHTSQPLASVDEALERVGLRSRAQLPCRMLSAGQRRRIALARLLLRQAALWVLDEPYTSLDRQGMALVDALINERLAQGAAVIMTSHHAAGEFGQTAQVFDLNDFAGESD